MTSGRATDFLLDLAILAAALIGAAIGFLWYNAFPAELFMGDTGSMAFGGALAGFAIVTGTEALLLLIAGIYVVEALSVIIQTVSFKYWGRRVFLIAPIHHHFEMKAWSETKIMVRFWIVAAILCRLRLRPLLPLLPPVPALRRALVLGLARSGRAAQAALEAGGTEVVAADRTLGNDEDLSLLDGVDVLVKSPGVPGEAPLVAAARERGIPVWSEIELAARLLPNPILGVTGTNGKTTTTELLGAMLGARTAGNVGTALSELVGDVPADDWIVCELSSFQLEDVDASGRGSPCCSTSSPTTSTGTAASRRTADAKLRIFENQTGDDVAVVPRGFGPVPGCRAPRRVRGGRRAAGRAADPGRAQPRERGRRDRRRPRRRHRRCGDRGGAAHVPRRRAPARARGRDRRRPLRQRLEGDEHRRRAPRADGATTRRST